MKQFLIVGNGNAITNKDTFPLFKENKIWFGINNVKEFRQPNDEIKKFGNICWFTNLDHAKRNRPLDLFRKYSNECYPHYDNYDAIDVSKTCEIPMDYEGVMGVPITFLNKYNPNQFEIIWQASGNTRASAPTDVLKKLGYIINEEDRGGCGVIGGVRQYSRIFIRHRKAQLMEYGKKFLVIGSQNAITYKEVFPLIKNNELWLGTKYVKEFFQPNGEIKKFGNICWFTNLDHEKRNKPLDLYKHYSNEYKHYDNYDAIEVSKVCDIPMDYDGVMGVPITFLDKYCPEQFEIVKFRKGNDDKDLSVNGVCPYFRILIRHRK